MQYKEINRRLKNITDEKLTKTLSGRGKNITYVYKDCSDKLEITWGDSKFTLSISQIDSILNQFFVDDEWYPLGSSMTNPMEDGLGNFIANNFDNLTSRHASAIAAILVNENLIANEGAKPIKLKKYKN
ncbi:MAG: hypothetical protein K9K76_07660 [Halanaerobiales bacterium]|nr:hypothetical protein [Halanaerobiales bacterium]